jgi:hypothetical protein
MSWNFLSTGSNNIALGMLRCSQAFSTAEVEYVALSHAVKEAIWLRYLLKDLGWLQLEAIPIQRIIKLASKL